MTKSGTYVWALLLTSLCSQVALATENSGYVQVTEIKTWPTKSDIYLTVEHNCGGTDTVRYHLSKDDDQQYSLLLAALSAGLLVNLNYTCDPNGYPSIIGVRAKR